MTAPQETDCTHLARYSGVRTSALGSVHFSCLILSRISASVRPSQAFSPPDSAPQESESDYEEESDESEEEEESDDDYANDVCYRCGGRGHWASDCGEPYSYYGYGRY